MVRRTLVLLSLSILTALSSQATTTFKSTSVLSTGKWVKIRVGETGVYEITEQQLREFGFSDPSAVKVFGQGGFCPTENFQTVITDDLEQVAALHENGKIYFYAKGLAYEKSTLKDYTNFTLTKTITTNPYTADCYYFLTDRADITPLEMEQVATTDTDLSKPSEWYTTGVATVWHKKDLVNPTRSGKLFLGEDLSASCSYSIDFSTPGIVSGSTVMVNTSTAIKCDSDSLFVTVNGDRVGSKHLGASSDATIYKLYNISGSTTVADTYAADEKTSVKVAISDPAPIARIDYIAASYTAALTLPSDSSQMRYMIKMAPNGSTGVKFNVANTTTKLWRVATPADNVCITSSPTDYPLLLGSDGIASVVLSATSNTYCEFALFDTAKEQKHVTFAGDVANQNLHSLSAPVMLIITTAKLREQAERLAEYHRTKDKFDVVVVDHNDVYNEFGYGMRSAMAYRQLCRMFYDRAATKFRYLMLFGGGSYDNRCIFGGDPDDMLVAYESDTSNHAVTSYTTDDFFGVMSDYAQNVESGSAYLAVSIGRVPFVSVSDAKTYVDKLLNYMNHRNDKNDMWKSNMLVIGENGDSYIHTRQAESFITNFNYTITSGSRKATDYTVNFNKIYFEPYDQIDNLNGTREKFVENLNAGQNFVLFIGHSNPTSTTKSVNFLTLQQAVDTKYEAIPMMYFSSCDIGRFDGGITTVLDKLMLNPNGGVIAAVSASREAYTSLNGNMTDSFAKYLGISETESSYNTYEKTWGRILMLAKNNTDDRSRNRLKYHMFGDPAIRVTVPHSRTHISTVDGSEETDSVAVGTMKPITLTGYVADTRGSVDTYFNGDAKITLFDSDQFCMKQDDTSLTQRGAELATTTVKVENGKFTATLIVPNSVTTGTNAKPLQTTAISESGTVVSGFYNGLHIDRTKSAETDDTVAPTISEFYLGDKAAWRDGMTVDSAIRVHATISDNVALNTSNEQIATTAYLSLDGGDHTYALTGTSFDGQDKCTVDQPIYNLTAGRHTLQLTVADIAGNISTRTIAFFVEGNTGATLSMSATAVADDDVTFDLDNADTTDGTIVVSSADGSVKMRSDVSFPYTWDGCDNNGTRLAEGVYNVSAIIDGKSLPAKKIVVVKQ